MPVCVKTTFWVVQALSFFSQDTVTSDEEGMLDFAQKHYASNCVQFLFLKKMRTGAKWNVSDFYLQVDGYKMPVRRTSSLVFRFL